ncbi:TolC family protein [Sphingomonas sp. Leaf25]|uniref:TolC family protein n=1 Tax=Sphingomonas sp. Leaf25 TaxID=1735692 RepID=UPI0006F88B75|nr:TolC family protein [Sphingomonas sp. Leaf25]KQM98775.1 hypothetical protein ASE78_05990 [Sphingomonas sp. Leaf25]
MSVSPCWRRVLALAAVLAAAPPAAAQLAPPFPQLLAERGTAPRIAALDARTQAAQGLADQARARPNPTISGYVENIGGSDPYGGFARAETTIQLNHVLELGGKRAARIAAGIAGVDAARARAHAGRVAYAHDLARAYAMAEIAGRRIDLAEEEVAEATTDLKVARAMVAAGKEARLRELRADSEVAALTADLAVTRAAYQTALAQLAVLAGTETPYTGLSASLLDTLPPVVPVGPPASPEMRVALAERDAATARIAAERKRALPDVSAQIGIRRLEADRATALVAGISLPLTLFDRNRGNIAAAEAERTAAEIELNAQRQAARTMAAAAATQVAAADQRAAAAVRSVATATETYRLTRIAYESGKAPLSEVLIARHDLGVVRGTALDAAAARIDARAALARLHGQALTGAIVE